MERGSWGTHLEPHTGSLALAPPTVRFLLHSPAAYRARGRRRALLIVSAGRVPESDRVSSALGPPGKDPEAASSRNPS